jgi:glycosyltransferase involved in cell wall biosynthesis
MRQPAETGVSAPVPAELPRITVVTPTFNSGVLLPDTLKSLRAQDYPKLEWIVIDGGSTDGTLDFLRDNDDTIDYWLSEPDHGMYDALAKGFKKARGGILCWLNSGDMLLPGALVTVAEVFNSRPDVNWITGIHFWHLPGCRIIGCFHPPAYRRDLIRCGAYGRSLPYIEQEATFFRRTMLEGVDTDRFRTFRLAGDLFLWTCFAKKERLTLVSAGFGSFCIHEGQLSEDRKAYWKEARTFLEARSVFSWVVMLLQKPLKFAPTRIKKMLAGDAMLTWRKGGGWE